MFCLQRPRAVYELCSNQKLISVIQLEIKIENTEILNLQIIYFHFKNTISFDNLNLYFQTIFFKHINRKLIIQRTSCLISKQTNYFFQTYFLHTTASEKIVKMSAMAARNTASLQGIHRRLAAM